MTEIESTKVLVNKCLVIDLQKKKKEVSLLVSCIISNAKTVLDVIVTEIFLLVFLFPLPISNSIFNILQDFANRKSLCTSKWVESGWNAVLSRERMGHSALGGSTVHLEMNSFILILSSTLAPFCFNCHKHLLWSQCSVLKRFFLCVFLSFLLKHDTQIGDRSRDQQTLSALVNPGVTV